MSVLYISKHGAVLRISGERLIVTYGKERLLETPGIKVDQVVIFGNGQLSPQAMDYLLNNNIDVAYLSASGRYRGRLQPPLPQNALVRKAQYRKSEEDDFCLKFSKAVIAAKIRNSIHMLVKKGARKKAGRKRILRDSLKKLDRVKYLDKLRGIEGAVSAGYFQVYRELMKNDMGFSKRLKHPAPDPANILLSLGYTLLYNFVHSMINLVGMDPYQGFLHQNKFGHASLASDIIEPMRAPVVDALVLRVLNLKIINEKDFIKQNGRMVFRKEGLKRYLEEYDKKMLSKRQFAPEEKRLDFKQIIEWQCRQFARVILGKESEIKPYLWGRS